MSHFMTLLYREIRLSICYLTDSIGAILFFVLTASLFPLTLNINLQYLQQIAPGILWVCALLAALLPLERIFCQDYEDGSLEQLLLLETSFSTLALTKMTGHWFTTAIPLLCATIPLSLTFNFPTQALFILILTLLLGTGCLSLVGGMTSCIALGSKRNSFLLPLLTFPLLTPVLIFGTMTTNAYLHHLEYTTHLQLLTACFLFSLSCCPFVAGAGLKLAIE